MREKLIETRRLLIEAGKLLLQAGDLLGGMIPDDPPKKPPLSDAEVEAKIGPRDKDGNPTKLEPGKTITFAKEGENLK